MTSVGEWRQSAAGVDRLDCDVLLAHALDCNRAEILAHPERELSQDALRRLNAWRARRADGEPLAYILRTKEFWGLDFTVGPDVLIPRPESELLVEHALEILRAGDRLLDLGTGSGALAIAICKAKPTVRVTASDISQAALAVARENALLHETNVTWRHSDWFARITGTFDVIVSNPPYVAEHDPHLADLGSEPRQALVAGPDGLDAIRHIVASAHGHLAPGGWLLLEHGYEHAEAVRELLRDAEYGDVCSARDLGGHPRISKARKPR